MAKVYEYQGKRYSENYWTDAREDYDGDLSDLLYQISKDYPNIYREETVILRYIGDEYSGSNEEQSDEEVIDELIDYGFEEVEEVK